MPLMHPTRSRDLGSAESILELAVVRLTCRCPKFNEGPAVSTEMKAYLIMVFLTVDAKIAGIKQWY